jgi:predicted AlkP superfamily phosphohydrolase/phosphomutase
LTVTGGLTAVLAGLLAGCAFLWGFIRRLGGFGRRHWGKIAGVICAIVLIGALVALAVHRGESMAPSAINGRVVLLGFDGLSPELIEPLLADGKLPNFQRLKERGCYARLATTNPSQSPVAWSTFATGRNPGKHGICDFITRKPGSYLPDLSLASLEHGRSRPVRQTKAFWDYGAEAHVPMVILSCPVTFPPEPINGRMLAGMGVPDLLGTQGTFAFYTTEKEAVTNDTGGEVFVVEPADLLQLDLLGPYKAGLTGKAERMKLPFQVRISSDRTVATVSIQGQEFGLAVGEWSGWVNIEFRIGPFRRMRGLTRFHLTELQPHLKLYVSPISLDPREPWFPIYYPKDYSAQLAAELGVFSTRGMPFDTWALNEGRIGDDAFLAHAEDLLEQQTRLLLHELKRCDKGVLYGYFEYPDVIQHMYWRFIDERHPLYDPNAPAKLKSAISDCYRRMDQVLGQVLDELRDGDTLMVLSDHGFTSFRRAVHLNSWLFRRGLLSLRGPDAQEGLPLFESVDWSGTRAYALGFTGIYLNLKGREPQGIVNPGLEADALKRAIADSLKSLEDPVEHQPVFSNVWLREEVFKGDQVERAPDIVVGTNKGWRVSWQTALGAAPKALIEDNRKRWSGDHMVDPGLVPGILFCNRKITAVEPTMYDIAPTVLRLMGFSDERLQAEDLDGRPLFR